MSPVVMGIDQSQNGFGWAVMSPEWDRPRSGVLRFEKQGMDETPVFRGVQAFLLDKVPALGVTRVYIEQTYLADHQNINSEFVKIGIAAIIMLIASNLGLPTVEAVPIQSWRYAFIPGSKPKGFDWKTAVRQECKRRGWPSADHNEAEALAIMDYALGLESTAWRRRSLPLFNGRPGRVMA